MASQSEPSVHQATGCCLLLAALLVLPALAMDSLLCNYCPLLAKDKKCPNVTSECRPQERCYSSKGLDSDSVHKLSGQGCATPDLCGTSRPERYMGRSYDVSYTCCCRDQCNQPADTPPAATPDPQDACREDAVTPPPASATSTAASHTAV